MINLIRMRNSLTIVKSISMENIGLINIIYVILSS